MGKIYHFTYRFPADFRCEKKFMLRKENTVKKKFRKFLQTGDLKALFNCPSID